MLIRLEDERRGRRILGLFCRNEFSMILADVERNEEKIAAMRR